MTPPADIIAAAVRAARQSPCVKSQRGVVVYARSSGIDIAAGWNGPPGVGARCAGDDNCREACGKICVHAEMRALRTAHDMLHRPEFDVRHMAELDAVHVKIGGPGRELVDGGGPSCWQCSREVLDVGLGGFWLYETQRCTCPPACASHRYPGEDGCTCELHGEGTGLGPLGRWRRYSAIGFHAATLAACGLPPLVTT